jgi:hypothetical protein
MATAIGIQIYNVRLVNGMYVPIHAAREGKSGGVSGGVIAASVLVSPFFLLLRGSQAKYEAGTEFRALVEGDNELDRSDFVSMNR